MSEKRVTRQYEVEFKLDAVRLVEEQGYSVAEAAQRLGIPKSNLTNWHKPQSDVTEGVTGPPVRFLVGELTMNLVRHCTGISEERDETVSLVRDIFRTSFF